MRERPILFSGAMVRALLDGTKTQTRRALTVQPPRETVTFCAYHHPDPRPHYWACDGGSLLDYCRPCPYGQPGDRLWVREAFRFTDPFDADSPSRVGVRCLDAGYKKPWAPVQFEADRAQQNWIDVGTPTFPPKDITAGKLRPGMFMPRWASRILLEVTEVRVEHLQDISRGDAMAEGCPFPNMAAGPEPRQWYADLWDSLGGDWAANPWVWAVSFKRLAPPLPHSTKALGAAA